MSGKAEPSLEEYISHGAVTMEDIAHKLLADKSVGKFSKDICVVNENQVEDTIDLNLFRFEMMQDISMEVLHQYLFLIKVMRIEEEGLDGTIIDPLTTPNDIEEMSVENIEKLLKVKLAKIMVLPSINEVPDDTQGYYMKIKFYDTVPTRLKKHFHEKKYHYFGNAKWLQYRPNIKSLEDVFSVFNLGDKLYSLKFTTLKPIEKPESVVESMHSSER